MNNVIFDLLFFVCSYQLIIIIDKLCNIISLAVKRKSELDMMLNGAVVIDHLYYLTPHEFEEWCGLYLKKNGYEDIEVIPGGPDGGRDIICRKDGVKVYVECKSYAHFHRIDVDIVEKLVGAMLGDGVRNGIIMTTGEVGDEVRQYIRSVRYQFSIRMFDRFKLSDQYWVLLQKDALNSL